MCLQGACPCLAGGNTDSWLELTPEVITKTYESTRTPASFLFTADGYDSYDSCINKVEKNEDNANAEFYEFAKAFREQDDFAEIEDYIKFFEEEYSCAGICSPALFYFYRSVSEGVPGGSCLLSIQDDLKTSLLGVGGAALASGIFLFFTFIFQYCLWRKYDE